MVKKGKQERTVIHLEMNGEHYYLGSLAAIYQFFDSKTLGISYGSLRNFGLSHEKPYQNKHCIIRKGVLLTISKKNDQRETQHTVVFVEFQFIRFF